MKTIIYNGTIILDEENRVENGFLVMEEGKIVEINDDISSLSQYCKDCTRIDAQEGYIIPGFIDIHIHGAMCKDLIEGTQEAVDSVAKNVVEDGCTAFMASLTVVSHNEMLAILKRYKYIEQPNKGAHFLGIHEEGPYLSKEYKALMNERYLRDPSIQEYIEMQEASGDKIKIMTVAPELDNMQDFINHVSGQGVNVMIGHSNATAQDVRMAVRSGARGFTHLYNAMSQHLHRAPGCVSGAMIEQDTLAELICDGFHVDKDVVLATYRTFTSKRLILITDAMLGKGADDGEYIFSNLRCQKEGKFVRVIDTGRIAGSAFGMIDAVRFIKELTQCSMNEIVEMACVNPAKIANVLDEKGTIALQKDADICVLSKQLEVLYTFVSQEKVYEKEKHQS